MILVDKVLEVVPDFLMLSEKGVSVVLYFLTKVGRWVKIDEFLLT